MVKSIVAAFILFLLLGCSYKDLCSERNTNIPFESFADSLYCRFDSPDSILTRKGVHHVIENVQDLNKYVYCFKSLPNINFDTHYLVAGKIFYHTLWLHFSLATNKLPSDDIDSYCCSRYLWCRNCRLLSHKN